MSKEINMYELFKTDQDIAFELMVEQVWLMGGAPPEQDRVTEQAADPTCRSLGRVCMNCDDLYLYT